VARLFRIGLVEVRTADALTEGPKLIPTARIRRSRKTNSDFAPMITNIAISERKKSFLSKRRYASSSWEE